MGLSDKALGGGMLLAAIFIFVYYTTWAILLPLFPASHPLHDLFPAREWAIRLPAFILVVGLAAVGSFVGLVIMKENQKQARKRATRIA